MSDLTAKRTLVKSPPELWSELSELESLARHLGEFGEIRISRLEPERTVAWEGEHARGTVELEPSGWGTKVTLTAEVAEGSEPSDEDPDGDGTAPQRDGSELDAEPAAVEGEPAATGEYGPEAVGSASKPLGAVAAREDPVPRRPRKRRGGLLGRLFRRRHGKGRPLGDDPRETVEPVLAVSIADGTVEVVEPGSGRVRRSVESLEPEPLAEPMMERREHEPASAEPIVEGSPVDLERARAALEGTLDRLGQAHHRPFSRE